MDSDKPQVLFTKVIHKNQLEALHNLGWKTTCISFIECTFSYDKELLTNHLSKEKASEAYIFTSKNAANAIVDAGLTKYFKKKPVFCIGEKTGIELEKLGINVSYPQESNASALAQFILKNYPEIKYLTYFCGNRRREELPKILLDAGKVLKEFAVYKTELKPHSIDQDYEALVFYSPSAVEAFFQDNEIKQNCTVLALGTTTATEIEKYYKGNIEIPEAPNTEAVIECLSKIENV